VKKAVLTTWILLATSFAPARADIAADMTAGMDISAVFAKAMADGKSAAAAVKEMITLAPAKSGVIVSAAVKSAPNDAAGIVRAAIGEGADVYDVVKAAVGGAKDKTAEIVEAAVNMLPGQTSRIINAALAAGGAWGDIMAGVARDKMAGNQGSTQGGSHGGQGGVVNKNPVGGIKNPASPS
jgi:hypothetical protein